MAEDDILRDMLRSFRTREIEPAWEKLDAPDAARFAPLWETLGELGVTASGLPAQYDGMELDADCRLRIAGELGAACPALGAALIGHLTAQALLSAAAQAAGLDALPRGLADARFGLVGSPLDGTPDGQLVLFTDVAGDLRLRGSRRVMWPQPQLLCVPVLHGGVPKLCVVAPDAQGVTLASMPSSHGLCLLDFGMLSLEDANVDAGHVLPWPDTRGVVREADGLIAALLAGMSRELSTRASDYALQRYQGGKMIHEHDAVRQLIGPIEVGRRAIDAFARATLTGAGPADGAASAFAIELTRQAGLDAIQSFGGYGYMEDYRVERYLRDAGTLETMWIHADARRRQVAANRFAAMASQ